ncbi:hypothetical protein AB0M39_39585 [Streptomyces sp. NPDC051907]|uniref:hypothetical protein n=1 Tax=Streptomyces sp. NPDC051907 TaxID=3155284 RepID=UPI0034389F0F
MQCSSPRGGSLCLPSGPEGWRLVLVPLALMLGATAGLWLYASFGEAAQAVAVGITAADIAVQTVELALAATASDGAVTTAAAQPPATGRAFRMIPLITATATGAAIGWSFYYVFAEASEAVAVGVTAMSVVLRVVEMLLGTVCFLVVSCTGALTASVRERADKVRDFIDRFLGGFGGSAPHPAGAA